MAVKHVQYAECRVQRRPGGHAKLDEHQVYTTGPLRNLETAQPSRVPGSRQVSSALYSLANALAGPHQSVAHASSQEAKTTVAMSTTAPGSDGSKDWKRASLATSTLHGRHVREPAYLRPYGPQRVGR
jgi:hypothetical protein